MAIKGTKRASASEAAYVAKKCRRIGDALTASSGYPASAVRMCKLSINESLAIPRDQRHQFQNDTVNMIGKVLEGVQNALTDEKTAAEAKFQEAQTAPGDVGTAHLVADAAVKDKAEALAAAQKQHEACVRAVQESAKQVSAAETEQQKGDRSLTEASAKLAKLENCLSTAYNPLKEGSIAKKTKATASAVAQQAKTIGVETRVATSLATSLAKAPDMRGTYDQLILDTVDKAFSKSLSELKDSVEQGTPAKDERAAKVAEAHRVHEEAVASEKASKEALAAAKTSLATAKGDLKKATADLGPFAKAIKKAQSGAHAAQERLDEFTKITLQDYSELRDRSSTTTSA